MIQATFRERPTTMAGVFELNQIRMAGTRDSIERALAYQAQPTDLFIAPYHKCGTTWLQQIVHSLKTRGDMSFAEITQVIPWLELAHFLDIDLNQPQPGDFQAFKSHLSWYTIPKGGRYLVAFRDPKDALVSYFHYLQGWFFVPGSIPIADFARDVYMRNRGPQSYWSHLASWWQQRHQENVLLLCFEDMKEDLPSTVQTIAQFLGIELDDELYQIAVQQASLDFMQAHVAKYNEHMVRERADAVFNLPPGTGAPKVRNGRVGDHHHELPEDVIAEMDAIWKEEIEAKFGFASYQEVRTALKQKFKQIA